MAGADERAVFLLDLGNPLCYLAAERVLTALPIVAEWLPVIGRELGLPETAPDRERVGRRAAQLGLLPLCWPAVWPPDAQLATLTAMFAKGGGKTVSFCQALLRQQFAAGRDIGEETTVLLAAAAAEMHPAAVLKAVGLSSTRRALDAAHDRARTAEIQELPAITWRGRCFSGEKALELAATAMRAAA